MEIVMEIYSSHDNNQFSEMLSIIDNVRSRVLKAVNTELIQTY